MGVPEGGARALPTDLDAKEDDALGLVLVQELVDVRGAHGEPGLGEDGDVLHVDLLDDLSELARALLRRHNGHVQRAAACNLPVQGYGFTD